MGVIVTESKKILLIEDEEISRHVIATTLAHAGFQVESCEHGKDGLSLLLNNPKSYGLVILDWMMPVMDGMTFLRELKRNDQLRSLPVLMLTALSDSEEVIEALEAGAFDYLTKPVNPNDLLVLVSRIV